MLKQINVKKVLILIAMCVCFFSFNSRVKAEQVVCYYKTVEFGSTNEDIRMTYEKNASKSVPMIQYIGKDVKMNATVASFKVSDFSSKGECPKELHGVAVEAAKNSKVYSGRFYLDRKDAVAYSKKTSGNVLTSNNVKKSQQSADTGGTSTTDTSGTTITNPADAANSVAEAAKGIATIFRADVTVTVKEGASNADDGGCSKLGPLSKYIGGGFSFVRYAIPTIIIVLSVLDFLGVVFSGEDENMEKAKKHFIIRIIVGILILFVPFMLEFILRIAGIIDGNLADAVCNFIK